MIIEQVLTRNIDTIYPSKDSLAEALGKKKLTIYMGIDPTNPNIHIGNAVPLWKLREIQDLGHKIIFLIGDFTSLIGDPTGKDVTRPLLTKADAIKNAKTYVDQAGKILDFKKNPPEVLHNSEWNSRLKFDEIIKLTGKFTLQQMIERDMFQKRLKEGSPIGLHELLYPIVQGYDSVMMKVDIEIGGTDQTFNMLLGREMVKESLNKEKFVITTPLLPGNDGRKMSKSYGNVINITDSPKEMFGKAMTVKDDLLKLYLTLTTPLPEKEINDLLDEGPLRAKKRLGHELVKRYHSEEEAKKSQDEFDKTFSKGELPSEITSYVTNKQLAKKTLVEFLVEEGVASSNSDARRLIQQGGVVAIDPATLAEQKIEDGYVTLEDLTDKVVKSRRNWIRIVKK